MHNSSTDQEAAVTPDKSGFSDIQINEPEVSASETKLTETENSEKTLRRILSSYEIGAKLRHLRLRKKISLVDLGKHTGLSASMLSQLENGKLVPTLSTLARIAMVFDVGLEHFFADKRLSRTFTIVRAEERLRFPDRPDNQGPGFYFEVLAFGASEKTISAYLADFPKHAAQEVAEHSHEGSELVHVLEGVLGIHYQSEDHLLNAGDSVYFDASEPHSYFGQSDTPARAIVITTPPRL
ncbi:MAG: XRE family transcriptional regulator [Bryobacteraceae bacterium]